MKKSLWIFFLLFTTLVAVYPFVWMLLSCFKTNREIYQPTLLFPADYQWDAFLSLFDGDYLPFWQILSNSLFISIEPFISDTVNIKGVEGGRSAFSNNYH